MRGQDRTAEQMPCANRSGRQIPHSPSLPCAMESGDTGVRCLLIHQVPSAPSSLFPVREFTPFVSLSRYSEFALLCPHLPCSPLRSEGIAAGGPATGSHACGDKSTLDNGERESVRQWVRPFCFCAGADNSLSISRGRSKPVVPGYRMPSTGDYPLPSAPLLRLMTRCRH
jgi:hypothetical protein